MYKSFEELCLRVKSLFTWKLEQLNNSMPIKSLSDSFLLPELELIINDRGSLSRCLDAYYQKTMNFIQTALRLWWMCLFLTFPRIWIAILFAMVLNPQHVVMSYSMSFQSLWITWTKKKIEAAKIIRACHINPPVSQTPPERIKLTPDAKMKVCITWATVEWDEGWNLEFQHRGWTWAKKGSDINSGEKQC